MIKASLNPSAYQPWTLLCDMLGLSLY